MDHQSETLPDSAHKPDLCLAPTSLCTFSVLRFGTRPTLFEELLQTGILLFSLKLSYSTAGKLVS